MIEFIKQNILDIDFVLWTGDNVSHDGYELTSEIALQRTKIIAEKLVELNLPVFPINGNEDTFPDYQYEIEGK